MDELYAGVAGEGRLMNMHVVVVDNNTEKVRLAKTGQDGLVSSETVKDYVNGIKS